MFWRPSTRSPAASESQTVCLQTAQNDAKDDRLTFIVPQERLDAAALHARYLDDVFRYVARRVSRREEAEDITAETFAAAFESLAKFRGHCDPRLWLLGIARRKIADAFRRRQRRPETLASEIDEHNDAAGVLPVARAGDHEEPASAFNQTEANRKIRELMATLKEEQREALLLKYVEGLSINEMAIVMGRSSTAVNSLLQRARATVFQQGKEYFLNDEVAL
jgi:RNA polymerase sigma-70 factor (ECF subfamily)